MRTYDNLLKRAEQGEPVLNNLKNSLEYERKQLDHMDLSGFISPLNYSSLSEYQNKKDEAHQLHIETIADAERNIPLLGAAIINIGGIITSRKPRYNYSGYAENENVNDSK